MNEKNTMKSAQVKKSALNLIDVMLVVLIVLPLGLLIAFQVVSRSNEVTTVRLEYSLDVYGVSENVDTSKLASDILYTADDCKMGTVVGCGKVRSEQRTVTMEDSVVVQETLHCFTVTVACDAVRLKDGSYRIADRVIINEGDVLRLYSNDFVLEGSLVRMSEVIK